VDLHLAFSTEGVESQYLVLQQGDFLNGLRGGKPVNGTVGVYRLPFWHYTTPMVAKVGMETHARRWVLMFNYELVGDNRPKRLSKGGWLMLLVRTTLGNSLIHGIGVFATEFIPVGTPVWRFCEQLDFQRTREEVSQLPALTREWMRHYGYLDFQLNTYIICVDDARFINHSRNPNICSDYSSDRFGIDVAVRNIEPNEEITADYTSFCHSEDPGLDDLMKHSEIKKESVTVLRPVSENLTVFR
jgi:uncharacterized protein